MAIAGIAIAAPIPTEQAVSEAIAPAADLADLADLHLEGIGAGIDEGIGADGIGAGIDEAIGAEGIGAGIGAAIGETIGAGIDEGIGAGISPTERLAQAPPLFEDLFIGLNAPDRQARGLSGGPLPAMRQAGVETTSTGRCVGFVDREPDHRLTLSGFMDYLRLEVQSNADTSMVVRGPGGSWCNDNYRDRNPGMAGQWLAGTYEIWVGSPTNRDYYPYVLRVTQRPEDPATLPVPAGVP
jgi:hypothetical protein